MSENSLVAKIIADTDVVVSDIEAQAAARVKAIEQETEEKVAVLRETHAAALKKQQAQEELVAVSRAKQDGHLAVQRAKRQEIDELFSELEKELIEQSADDYVTFFTKYAREIVGEGVRVVSVEAPMNRLAETKRVLDNLGLSGEIVGSKAISAGFLLSTEDGVYDATLKRMMSNRRAELEMQVMQQVMA